MKKTLTRSLLAIALGSLLAAAPANATLLVRSDNTGLFIQDKNGLNDFVRIDRTTLSGAAAWNVANQNSFDVFAFDRQAGCSAAGDRDVKCKRFVPVINILVGSGDDRIFMFNYPGDRSSVATGAGDDRVGATAGVNNLHGQTGNDELNGGNGNDFVEGDENNDTLDGSNGNDTVEGGDGNDTVDGGTGRDILRGNPGNDRLDAKEPVGSGLADEIGCGGGSSDFLSADLVDVVPASCEEFEQSPVGETPHVRTPRSLRVSRSGRVRVRLRCPRGTRGVGCKGRLRLRVGRRSSRRVRYSIKAGRRKTLRLRLRRAAVRRVRARRTRGVLTSVERGRLGRKTTVRRPRLRLR